MENFLELYKETITNNDENAVLRDELISYSYKYLTFCWKTALFRFRVNCDHMTDAVLLQKHSFYRLPKYSIFFECGSAPGQLHIGGICPYSLVKLALALHQIWRAGELTSNRLMFGKRDEHVED